MASLEKLQIQGIRSFDNVEPQVLSFFSPLTLIVGHNGAGKTTVIECLKYATTGDQPPNTKGGAFVHDPNIRGVTEVKAQVKLKFKNVSGKSVVCTRSLLLRQKAKTMMLKTLDTCLQVIDPTTKVKTQLSKRCADVDREVPYMMGVSRPVLDNVIFCHQEESNWPLGEPKKLKDKFDDIFAATRYIKALDSIRKFRKDQAVDAKLLENDIGHIKQSKERADTIRADMANTMTRHETFKATMIAIKEELQPIQNEIAQLSKQLTLAEQTRRDMDLLTTEKRTRQDNARSLRKNMSTFFEGKSIEELQSMAITQETDVERIDSASAELQQSLVLLQNEERSHRVLVNNLVLETSRLKAEAAEHETLLALRSQDVQDLAAAIKLNGFSVSEGIYHTEEHVTMFIGQTRERIGKYELDYERERESSDEKLKLSEDKLVKVRSEAERQNEERRGLVRSLNKEKASIEQIEAELRKLEDTAPASRVEELRAQEQKCLADQASLKHKNMEDNLEDKLRRFEEEKHTSDRKKTLLQEEFREVSAQMQERSQIAALQRRREDHELRIKRIYERKRDDIESVFGFIPKREVIKPNLVAILKERNDRLRVATTRLQQSRTEFAKMESNLEHSQKRLDETEKDLDQSRDKLLQVCPADKPFNEALTEAAKDADEKACNARDIKVAKTVYTKYIKEATEKHACPLCSRSYDDDVDFDQFVHLLRTKIEKIPGAIAVTNEKKRLADELLAKLRALVSVSERVERVSGKELAELRARVSREQEDLKDLTNRIATDDASLALIQNEYEQAQSLVQDANKIVQLHEELIDVDHKITTIETGLIGSNTTRTMADVSADLDAQQKKSDDIGHEMERLRKDMTARERHAGRLSQRLGTIHLDIQRLKNSIERQKSLNMEKNERANQARELQAHVEGLTADIANIEPNVRRLALQHKELRDDVHQKCERLKRMAEEVKRKLLGVTERTSKIRSFIATDKKGLLADRMKDLQKIQAKVGQNVQSQESVKQKIFAAKEQRAQFATVQRNIQDNIDYRSIVDQVAVIQGKIQNKQKEFEGFDSAAIKTKHNDALRRQRDLETERQSLGGQTKMIEEQIHRMCLELKSDMLSGVDEKHRSASIKLKTLLLANNDLDKYFRALDAAVMRFHSIKMDEINDIIKDLWMSTYQGTDIDTIEIRSEADAAGAAAKRRAYNYRVVMIKGETALDMRGRCSAGQKVLASLVIRLALAETFCLQCGIFALDEPTTNLDRDNIDSFARTLVAIIGKRKAQRNFQLIIITHDEEFVEHLSRSEFVEHYLRVSKNDKQCSIIRKQTIYNTNA